MMGTPARAPLLAVAALFFALLTLQTDAGVVGTKPFGPLGKEFITAYLKNHNKPGPAHFEVFVTAYHDSTTVSITVNKSNFQKEFNVRKGETLIIPLSNHLEMLNVDIYDSTIIIRSNKVISVLALNSRDESSDTILVLPVNEVGKEYYVVTPSSGPQGQSKELFVANYDYPNTVDINLNGAVTFKGQNFKAGSNLKVSLQPYEVIQVLSNDDLSGTRILSTRPTAVASGHTCAGKEPLCSHVSEQLLPVPRWGTTFVVPPMNAHGQADIIYVTASQNTNVEYQLGESKKTQKMGAGEVLRIELSGDNTLFISASTGIQVYYYSSGGKVGEKSFSPYLVGVPSVKSYGTSYKVLGLPHFENNIAVLITKTSSVSGITFDQKGLSNLEWKPVRGCDYSWAKYDFGAGFSCHTLDLANIPFGLLSIGYSNGNAYGFPGIRISAPAVEVPQLPPSRSTQPSGVLGLEFVTSFLQNQNKADAMMLEILITAYFPSTTVSLVINKSNFRKQFIVEQGQTISVPLPKAVELHGSNTFDSSVIIKADKVISVMSKNYKGTSGAITVILPLNKLGKEYYVVTPPWGPEGEYKEFSITNHKDTNKVDIYLTGAVQLKGQTHGAGSILTVTLQPYQVLQIQSSDDLSGTRIVSTSPLAAVSGHSCSGQDNICSHVSQQLSPVSQWDTKFLVPVLCSEGQTGVVFVAASKNTRLEYEKEGKKYTYNLKGGQVLQIEITSTNMLDLTSSDGVLVFSFMKGGKTGQQIFYPVFMYIPGISSYGTTYKILGHDKFDTNIAVFVVKTSSTSEITFDGEPLSNVVWRAIPGSDYSLAQLDYGSGFSCHTVDTPHSPFYLHTIGYGNNRAYGTPAIRISGPSAIETPEDRLFIDLSGTDSVHYLGKDFIIPSPKSTGEEQTSLYLHFTVYFDRTTVIITFAKMNYRKELHLRKGQTVAITLLIPSELLSYQTPGYSILVTSNNVISLASSTKQGERITVINVLPMRVLGIEYYVVTPPAELGTAKEFSISNHQSPNKVDIYPTATVNLQGKTYPVGSKFTLDLEPFQAVYLQSSDDLSGTKITATRPVLVVSQSSYPGPDPKSIRLSTPLLPVIFWGKAFLVPALSSPDSPGIITIVASKSNTRLHYEGGPHRKTRTLDAGQVVRIDVEDQYPVYITSNHAIQVTYFSKGGKIEGKPVKPYVVNIYDVSKYDTAYKITGITTYDNNFAVITLWTSAVPLITLDGQPLTGIQWKPILGTKYSWAIYDLGKNTATRTMRVPNIPFGLLLVRFSDNNVCVSPATTIGELHPKGPFGNEFVIPTPRNVNSNEPTSIELWISGYFEFTSVTIFLERANFKKEVTIEKGQTIRVEIPIPKEMLGETTFSYSVIVQSDKPVTVTSLTHKGKQVKVNEVLPLQDLGVEYYVVTPSGVPSGGYPGFSIANYKGFNPVDIYLTAAVKFEGKDYQKGSKISLTLKPFQQVYIQSRDYLSGTKIVSSKPVAVMNVYSCSRTDTECHDVATQYLPVPRWGTTFLVPASGLPDQKVHVYVVASQETEVKYQLGEIKEEKTLAANDLLNIKMRGSDTLVLTANRAIEVLYHIFDGKIGDRSLAPYMVRVPNVRDYATMYKITAQPNFDKNFAVFIAKAASLPQITFDGKPLPDIKWKPILGTEYSWGMYDYGTKPGSHVVEHPQIPFGLFNLGYNDVSSSANPATPTSALQVIQTPEEMPIRVHPHNPVGQDFIIIPPKNVEHNKLIKFLFTIKAYFDATTVTITFVVGNIKKEITLVKGQIETITIPITAEMLKSGTPGAPVTITSDKPISVTSIIYIDIQVQTAEVVPLQQLGVEYYVLTPPGKSDDDNKEFTIANFREPNEVTIYPTETVNFQGQIYKPGSKITTTLKPFEVIHLTSKGNPSGTRVLATHPVVVTCGYSSAETVIPSYQVSTQLHPVSQWGTKYLFPSLARPGSTDLVFVVASQPSQVEYRVNDHKQSQKVKAGEVIQIVIPESSTVSITADVPVQLIYYRKGDKTYESSFINIPDKRQYSSIYEIIVNPNFEKTVAIITMKTSAVSEISIDGKPFPEIKWEPIHGTEYSTAIYDLSIKPGTHIVETPDSPFGIIILGYPKQPTIEGPETTTGGVHPYNPFGKDFIIIPPKNVEHNKLIKFVITIKAYFDATTVTITFVVGNIKKEITLVKGQIETITIPITAEMLKSGTPGAPVTITSDKPISVTSIIYIDIQVQTAEVVPLQQLGVEYYVLTPPGKSDDDNKEFTIANFREPNEVTIYPTETVNFQGQIYKPGSKITTTLKPFEVIHLTSKGNPSGTRVLATHPVVVTCGYSSAETVIPSYQVSTQLHPVSQWGTKYLFPSLARPGSTDLVFVVASQPSQVEYRVNDHKQSQRVKAGEVIQIVIPESSTVSITADVPVQVIYYRKGDKTYESSFINIPDKRQYSSTYEIIVNPNFEKTVAIITMKTSAVSEITIDGKPFPNIKWEPIHGTEYSTAIYDLSIKPGTHIVETPDSPFGIIILGYPKRPEIPTGGGHSNNPVGQDFIIIPPKNVEHNKLIKFVFTIKAYYDATTVTITFVVGNIKKEITLVKGQIETITIPITAEMLKSGTPGAPVTITSDKPISVTSIIYIDFQVQTAEVVPLQQLGVEYYVLTPPGKSDDDNKEFTIANFREPNEVTIYPTETVNFKGQIYKPGSKITTTLKPFEVIHLTSKGNLSGTRVLATHPVVVTCGYSSAETVIPSYQVSTQLHPVSQWGTKYLFPSLARPGSTDLVFVVASQPSQVEYRVNDHKQSQKVKAGEVIQIVIPESSTVSITADVPVQLIYYRKGDKTYESSFINIPDKRQYSSIYEIIVNPNFEKTVAIITIKTSAVPEITIDGKPFPNIEWEPIHGTEYSTAIYDLSNKPGTHIVETPDSPFGIIILGYPKQETIERPGGENPSLPVGKEFVIPIPTFHTEKPVKFEFQVTAQEPTTVTIIYEPAKFRKEVTLEKGQTTTITIIIPPGMLQKDSGAAPFIITSANSISLTVIFHIDSRVETIEPVPLQQHGVEYYVLTPPGKSENDNKEFSIANFQEPNNVDIYPTETVVFQGQTYKPGTKITASLKPFEVIRMKSKGNLSGTRIIARKPIAVFSGYSSPETVTPSYQVTISLHPVSQWGKEFLFPSLASPGNTDLVFVVASRPTNIQFQVGDHKHSQTLKAGEVTQIGIPELTTFSITADQLVQVTYFGTAGKIGDKLYEPYLLNIPHAMGYAPKYKVTSNPKVEKNRAILIVKISAVPLVTFDGKSLSNIEWKPIPGTDYATAIYEFGNKPTTHIVETPGSPFGLVIIGYPEQPSIEKPGNPIGGGENPSVPVGKEFVIPIPTFHTEKPVKFEFQVTAQEPTTVTIIYEPAKFRKEVTLEKGQTTTITIIIPPGMLQKDSGGAPFIITSANPISLNVIFHIDSRVETIEPVPLQQHGVEYYVLTPPGKSENDNKEFSIANFQEPNNVDIYPTETVVFQGQTYKPGTKITASLKPFEVIRMKSKGNLSGTRIIARKPIAVFSGYSSPETVTPSYQVTISLHPVSQWGKEFLFPSLASPGNTDLVFVVASRPTNIQFQVGDHKQSQTLKAGEVTQIGIPELTTFSITADQLVQVTYFGTAGKIGDKLYEPYLLNIPHTMGYAPKYKVTSNPKVEKNRAILIVKISAVPLITFDGKSLSNIEWKPIPGTDYATAIYEFGNKPTTHIVETPGSPFGLMIIGYPEKPSIEKPGNPIGGGENPSVPVGKEFVIPIPTFHTEKPVKFEFQVTAQEPTTVTIIYEPAKFRKEVTLEKGQTTTITIIIPPGMLQKDSGAAPFIITSGNPISLTVIFHIDSRVETIEPVPLQQHGVEYYVLTPPGKSENDNKEFSIANFQEPNNVDIYPTETVVFQGQTYKPGTKITASLKPFEVIRMKSKGNLSGTRIIATKPIAVFSGYSSPETVTPSYQVTISLHPVSQWGKEFLFPSLASPGNTDLVFVVASRPTNIQFQVGDHKHSQTLKAGEVTQIGIPELTTFSITADQLVQVTYYGTAGKIGDRLYEPYLLNIPHAMGYAPKYKVTSNPKVEKNRAILIVKISAVPLITFDGKSLSNIEWKPIPGTDYATAIYEFGNKPTTHIVETPGSPFGLVIISYPEQPSIEEPGNPIGGENPSVPVGKEFVIPIPTIHTEKPVKFEFQVTAQEPTTVTIIYEPAKFRKEVTLEKGQTTTITIIIPPGILQKDSGAAPFIITSANPISLNVFLHIDSRVETIEPVPLQQHGVEYYVLTPRGKSENDNKEFSIANFQKPNNVDIYPTETVVFQGQTYKPGTKITASLKPFEVIRMKSKGNLSGTRIIATKPIAVFSGYSSPETVTPSYQVTISLHPVSQWGKEFLFPSLASPGNTDLVFVVASRPTNIQFQVGDHKQSQTLKAGEVTQIGIPELTTFSITADQLVQVTYYGTAGKIGDRLYEPYLLNIPHAMGYAPKYKVTSNPKVEKNRAILIVKISAVPLITFDGKSLSNIEWKPIPGTDYATAIYEFGNKPTTHIVETPGSPFGLVIISYPEQPAIEMPGNPIGGEKPPVPAGKEFVIPIPTIHTEKPVKFEFQVTAQEPTTVTIIYEPAKFRKEVTLEKGQTTTITIIIPPGILQKDSGAAPFIITSANPISLNVFLHIDSRVETIEPVPLQQHGVEYYVLTPPGKSENDNKEFSIANFQEPNNVDIYPTETVVFQGQTYKPGTKITASLKPFEVIRMKSKGNLSGTRIIATKPIAVFSGYSSPETVTPSYQVTISLHPVSQWGKEFLFPSLASPGNTDLVFVVASRPTNIQFQVGDHKQSQTLKAGEVTQIGIPELTTFSITADQLVQVTYYGTAGKIGDRLYEPYLLNIPHAMGYASKYKVTSNPKVEKNRAILIVKISAVPLITFDGKSLSNIEWKPIPGTDYATAIYEFGNKPTTHIVETPGALFGLVIISYPEQPAIEKPGNPIGELNVPELTTTEDVSAEMPSSGEQSTASVGTASVGNEFVIPIPTIHNEKKPVKFEFQVTAQEPTTVTIIYEPAKFRKEVRLEKGQTATITIIISLRMPPKDTGAAPFIITSERPISLTIITHTDSRVETIKPIPLQQEGVEYYVLTPPGKSDNDDKEFSIGNFQKPNNVDIYPSGIIVFQGQTYKPGNKITISLKPFEVIRVKSKDNLSGTRIIATNPITVFSGYSSPETVTPSYELSIPLYPVTQWGKEFFFPSLAIPGNTDMVFVVASRPTNIQFQVGDHKQSQTLKAGEVTQIGIPEMTTVFIRADQPVQATYYGTAGKIGDRLYENYLLNIPHPEEYDTKYKVTSNPIFEKNQAILIVKTSAVPLITFDGKSLSNIEWKPIPGTEYSTAIYDFGNKPTTHLVEAPGMPFGLLVIGSPKQPAIEKPGSTTDGKLIFFI
ncbi:hypothetical protein NDU88_010658 [Pleurodeles waltl]|uniref:IgGFc-binding protein N-terminal domain-containing protein n=1 Tax=Pleurodeles waltl TaxID=8319 RepID=A0AAV7PWN7_PLEWA|nr:hypothetical protein NDU88_010658 [Pleurodeles waltl]